MKYTIIIIIWYIIASEMENETITPKQENNIADIKINIFSPFESW